NISCSSFSGSCSSLAASHSSFQRGVTGSDDINCSYRERPREGGRPACRGRSLLGVRTILPFESSGTCANTRHGDSCRKEKWHGRSRAVPLVPQSRELQVASYERFVLATCSWFCTLNTPNT